MLLIYLFLFQFQFLCLFLFQAQGLSTKDMVALSGTLLLILQPHVNNP
jgi:hypothetical protein